MVFWAPLFFVRLLFFLVAGILAHWLIGRDLDQVVNLFLVFAAFYLICGLWFGRRGGNGLTVFFGVVGLGCTFLFGMALVQLRTHKFAPDHLLGYTHSYSVYRGKLDAYLVTKPTSYQTVIAVTHVRSNQKWVPVTARVQVTLPKTAATARLAYGHVLLIKGQPQLIKPPQNPGEFNYQQYQHRRNIYHQQFLQAGSFVVAGYDPDNPVVSVAFSIRQSLDEVLRQYLPGQQQYALAKALVLGIKDELDNAVIQAYSQAGTMHVLAVSGLHVGLLYGLLELVFRSKNKPRKTRIWLTSITLIIIWLYALITGFSASVLRAVFMFSLLSIGRLLNKATAMYHVLALSAFCLLVYNPNFLLDAGFQLSYLAVLGILYLYPKLERLLEFEHTFPRWVWTIACVSVAAQVFTLPLSLLYFHQVPVYFLPANLFIIPVSTAVMWGGIALVLLGWADLLAYWLGQGLNWLIGFMNQGIGFISSLPFAYLSDLYISAFEAFLLYVFLLAVLLFPETRQLRFFAAAAFSLLVLSGLQLLETHQQQKNGRFTVYALRKYSGVEITGKNAALFLADSALLETPKTLSYSISPNWGEQDAESPEIVSFTGLAASETARTLPDGNVLSVRFGYTFLLVRKPLKVVFPDAFSADFVVLQQNVQQPLAQLKTLRPIAIILDGSNTRRYTQNKTAEGEKLNLPVHAVAEKGAFVRQLPLH